MGIFEDAKEGDQYICINYMTATFKHFSPDLTQVCVEYEGLNGLHYIGVDGRFYSNGKRCGYDIVGKYNGYPEPFESINGIPIYG